MTHDDLVNHSPLGARSAYIANYKRELLFPILRLPKRAEISVPRTLPFTGVDVWNGYELSWLNAKGKPLVAIAEFIFPCESPSIIESKSFKLYLNSFNNTAFRSVHDVTETLKRDLSEAAGALVKVKVILVQDCPPQTLQTFAGSLLDDLDVECSTYTVQPQLLQTENKAVTETVYSNLLKSNCLVTGQPDWGSVQITYSGPQIEHAGLLQYIVSFRDHNEFHEQCVERIFMDILRYCKPTQLTVEARYTRRGGLDINPYRSTSSNTLPATIRLHRQ